jgi:cation-transporting ATPase 13A2
VVSVKKYDISTILGRGEKPIYIRMFKYRNVNFVYSHKTNEFEQVHYNSSIPFNKIYEMAKTYPNRDFHMLLFLKNMIDIPVKSYIALAVDETLHPFYIFQLFSVAVWMADAYYFYASAIFVISLVSNIISLVETRLNLAKLSKTAKYECSVNRLTPNGDGMLVETVSSEQLVPGDMIEIPDQFTMPCDCVLLQGIVIVNEAMLTGESIPVSKVLIPNTSQVYNVDNDRNHTLYAGTSVLQIRKSQKSLPHEGAVALVVRTGFNSAKGKLISSILYPKPSSFHFNRDSYQFMGAMFLFALAGMAVSLYFLIIREASTKDIVLGALVVIVTAVPPALPLAMTVGQSFAIYRLKSLYKIFCINPPRINVAGMLKLMCFDKTGTLTEDGLDLTGVKPVNAKNTEFGNGFKASNVSIMYSNTITYSNEFRKDITQDEALRRTLLFGMASCHGLTYVRGELVGDPLEVKIFNATNWKLIEPDNVDEIRHLGERGSVLRYNRFVYPVATEATRLIVNDSLEDDELIVEDPDAMNDDEATAVIHPEQEYLPTNELKDNTLPPIILATVKTFDFKSSLQRMSVIVKNVTEELKDATFTRNTYDIFVKGSPEILRKLSRQETIPNNFSETLNHYTHKGYRVLAFAHRSVKLNPEELSSLERETVECDLTFLGLVLMQNKVKSDTKMVIDDLSRNGIRNVMVTGDNPLTAVSVARQCGMIHKGRVYLGSLRDGIITWADVESDDILDENLLPSDGSKEQYELVVTGDVFMHLLNSHNDMNPSPYVNVEHPSTLHIILSSASVFARMTPDEKLKLVEEFAKLDYYVGMCGDGANDCGALKAAHVGISLSEAEASVAAPFTSQKPTIKCVVDMIREGRAALQTSFQMFEYMIGYAFITLFGLICCYYINSNLSDKAWMTIDIGIILPTAIFMSRTHASRSLGKIKPPSSLISRTVFLSIAYHLGTAFLIQIIVFLDIRRQRFYRFLATNEESFINQLSMEPTILWTVMSYQVMGILLAYSISKPFKKPLLTNFIFVICLVILMAWVTYVSIIPDSWHMQQLKLVEIPITYRVRIFGICMLYIISSYLFEWGIISGILKPITNLFSPNKWKFWYTKIYKRRLIHNKTYKNLAASVRNIQTRRASQKWLYTTHINTSITGSEYYRLN